MKRDYYELLGLAKGADPSAIKKPTESLLKSITRIRIPVIKKLKRNLKRSPKLIIS